MGIFIKNFMTGNTAEHQEGVKIIKFLCLMWFWHISKGTIGDIIGKSWHRSECARAGLRPRKSGIDPRHRQIPFGILFLNKVVKFTSFRSWIVAVYNEIVNRE